MNRALLEAPFADDLLRSRRGPFGKTFSYVEGTEYIRRLNDAFEGDWSFEVVKHLVEPLEVVVLGRLTAGGVTKEAFGGSSITISREGDIVSIADDLKAAATDSLKKAASLLGVGLHLYSTERVEPDADERNQDRRPNNNGRSRQSAPRNGNGNGSNGRGRYQQGNNGNGRNGNGNRPATNGDRLTQKQLSAIWTMGRRLGLSADDIRDRTSEQFGVYPEHLSRTDASAFITELGNTLDANAGN